MAYASSGHRHSDSQRKRAAIQAIKDKPCQDCGVFPSECMDFDHRDPATKSLLVSKVSHHGLQRLLDEAAKCDVVCANCHRIRTKNRRLELLPESFCKSCRGSMPK